MVRVIDDQRQAIEDLCRRFRVQRLELFGSAADAPANADPRDLDFLVEFAPLEPDEHFDTYFGLLEALQALFHRPIDLVMAIAIKNPYFLESVNRNRIVLYAA